MSPSSMASCSSTSLTSSRSPKRYGPDAQTVRSKRRSSSASNAEAGCSPSSRTQSRKYASHVRPDATQPSRWRRSQPCASSRSPSCSSAPSRSKAHEAVRSSKRSQSHSTTIITPSGAAFATIASSTAPGSATWCSEVQAIVASTRSGSEASSNGTRWNGLASGASGSIPDASYPASTRYGTNPPRDPQPISTTTAPGSGRCLRTSGQSVSSHRSRAAIPGTLRALEQSGRTTPSPATSSDSPSPPASASPPTPAPSRSGTSAVVAGRAPRLLAESVADRADGVDEACVLLAQLGPQPSHMDVDRPRAAVVLVAPHAVEQRLAREHLARMRREEPKELVLHVGEIEHAPGNRGLVRLEVQHERPALDRAGSRPAAGPSQQMLEARRYLAVRCARETEVVEEVLAKLQLAQLARRDHQEDRGDRVLPASEVPAEGECRRQVFDRAHDGAAPAVLGRALLEYVRHRRAPRDGEVDAGASEHRLELGHERVRERDEGLHGVPASRA